MEKVRAKEAILGNNSLKSWDEVLGAIDHNAEQKHQDEASTHGQYDDRPLFPGYMRNACVAGVGKKRCHAHDVVIF